MESLPVLTQAERALVAMDAESLVSLYADDFLFEDTSTGERITEKDQLREYFQRLFSLSGVNFSRVRFFGCGDRAAGQWTWSGLSLQSGQEFSVRGASLFKLDGDQIKEEVIFYDPRSAYS